VPAIRPIIVTADLDRLLAFYTGLLGVREVERYPEDGPAFSVVLALGDSELNLVGDTRAEPGSPGRILLSVEVPDVDALLERVPSLGGHVQAPANDMPWGQRVAHIGDPDGNDVNLTQAL
jgi:predicted enzyme related to lactoylglutathione lyase